jgi:hypothetical protein
LREARIAEIDFYGREPYGKVVNQCLEDRHPVQRLCATLALVGRGG